ncbi:MAG: transcriptional regulator [Verrucomicrobia bacterium]|nr:transcriptional regulator [Verrucomicrobiota bacterium]
MNEGDVVLAAFPQADGKIKNRPAIVLRIMPPFNDLLVCGVSRQLRQRVPDFDDIIAKTDADFAASGLLDTSLIRLGFLALLPASEFLGDIGSISPERHHRLLRHLATYLQESASEATVT